MHRSHPALSLATKFKNLLFILWFTSFLVVTQLIYWLVFYFSLSRSIKAGASINVPASVIVCAHDEEQNLRELIPLLLNQQHEEFEIIVVDDRSNDGTYDLLLEETKKDTRLKMVHVNHKPDHLNGKKYALTLGIKAAKHDWVLLTDADCRPASKEWIQQMASGFSDTSSIVLGYSPYLLQPGLLNSFIRFETMITAIQYFSWALIGFPYMGVGRNLSYRKKLFLAGKGFNDHMSVAGGDDDLMVNQHATNRNVVVMLNEKSIVFSKPKTTWNEFYQQKVRHLAAGKHYSWKSKLLLSPFMLSWILAWPLLVVLLLSIYWKLAMTAILLRWAVQILTITAFNKKTSVKLEIWKTPLLDFIFCFYYLVAGFKALATKRIQWKT